MSNKTDSLFDYYLTTTTTKNYELLRIITNNRKL